MFRSKQALLLVSVFVFVVLLGSSASAARRRSRPTEEETEQQRSGRVLSLFNVVSFENEPCASNAKTGSGNTRNGTCYTSSECKDKGGTHSGNCAAGFGVCCVFTVEDSGDSINQNCSYLRNPGFPSTYTGSETRFTNTINKCSCDVCHIRLDFEAFTMLGTADTLEQGGGTCVDSFTVTTSTGESVPTICGNNNGKHMYVDVGTGCSETISVATSFTGSSTIRRWDIKVSQIECGNPMAPPAGCTEYLTSPVGRITSYNFNNVAETHLANQEHKICIRSTKNSCCVRYTMCEDNLAFSIFNAIADLTMTVSMINTECSEDYIEAQSFTPDCYPMGPSDTPYRLCGHKFNTVSALMVNAEAICDCNADFSLLIRTDGDTDETGDGDDNLADRSKGVCLDYSLINCY